MDHVETVEPSPLSKWDLGILARTLFGEARGEPIEGIEAVASVVMNRLATGHFGRTVQEVCLRPSHFSCWNGENNRNMLMSVRDDNPHYHTCKDIAERALFGLLKDNTDHATHYHNFDVEPSWEKEANMRPTVTIGHHKFYEEA